MLIKANKLLARHSIGGKIFYSMAFLILVSMLLIGWIIYSIYSESMRENEIKYNILATNTIKTKFDMTIEIVINTAETLSLNKSFTDYITRKNVSINSGNDAASALRNIQAMQPFIESVKAIDRSGNVYSADDIFNPKSGTEAYDYSWDQFNSNHKEGFWYVRQIAISYALPVFSAAGEPPSFLIIMDISYDYLREMFMLSAIKLNEKVIVVDNAGNTMFRYPHSTSFEPFLSNYPEILSSDALQTEGKVYGIDSVIYAEKLNLVDWRIIRIIQTSQITSQSQKVVNTMSIVGGLLLLFCIVYSYWISRSLTKPIKELNSACIEVEKGNMDMRVSLDRKDELGNLGSAINMMLNQVQAHLNEQLEEQKRKAEMQFEILQAQINPHFLYNTLDSIKWLAELKNISSISDMTSSLIQLLKYNLTNSTKVTSLREEAESVQNYITIQKFRYSDSFNFEVNIDEATKDCAVVRFILQPLVENCIIHGFEDWSEDYLIQISSFIFENKLYIRVVDNGAGMDPEQMRKINDPERTKHRFNNIGIPNIRERIKLYFGEEYDVRYNSSPGVGTIAEIMLPVQRINES